MTASLLRRLFYAVGGLLVLAGIGLLVLFFTIIPTIPQLPDRLDEIFGQPTEVYGIGPSGEPVLVATFGGRMRVPLDQMADEFKHALLAVEDDRFYEHHGVNKLATVRALISNLRSRDLVGQGASTITQQLARNLFFSFEKRWKRKLREMLASFQIETRFSKDEILSAYCNHIYFGANAYGIESAAQTYFGKHASELLLGEAALLAGLPQAPSVYDPYKNMPLALERRRVVLDRMAVNGYITPEQARQVADEPVVLKGTAVGPARGPYFIDYVRHVMIERYGVDLVDYGGLKIYTTMDIRLQEAAQEAVKEKLAELDEAVGDSVFQTISLEQKKNALQAALVAIETKTGAVRAIVGGRDFAVSEYNRAVQSNRHPGSGFKPVIYLAAVDRLGYMPNTVVVDEPVSFPTGDGEAVWEPQNFSRDHQGEVILKKALMRSLNVISAKLIDELTPPAVVDYARRLGITSKLPPLLSLALGTAGVSPLEIAAAYAVFATEGIYRPPFVIARVEDSRGRVLEETKGQSKRVVSEQSAYLVLDMMRGAVEGGTAFTVRQLGFDRPCAGKTGTTSDSKDAWFNGFTPTLATSVWVGYDDARPLKRIKGREMTGAAGAIPIWVEFMKRATEQESKRDFPVPLGIEFLTVNSKTGAAATPADTVAALRVAVRGATPVTQ
ncbi:MAG: PBP1A family penicillin-binding protein [Candidatus Latescibacteria bacterium]|nr:PBP1A family penicillin-binding protein [Candidatus Latescibacterota bacterium]